MKSLPAGTGLTADIVEIYPAQQVQPVLRQVVQPVQQGSIEFVVLRIGRAMSRSPYLLAACTGKRAHTAIVSLVSAAHRTRRLLHTMDIAVFDVVEFRAFAFLARIASDPTALRTLSHTVLQQEIRTRAVHRH